MTLTGHVDPESLEAHILHGMKKVHLNKNEEYVSRYSSNQSLPKYKIPKEGTSGDLVAKYINEELALDGVPTLNLASFVTTEVDNTALQLICNNLTKNLADNDEYPSLISLQERCISILSNLWNAPAVKDHETGKLRVNTLGTATTGSSEAIMLAGLALKKNWQQKRRAEGKSTENPNIIMASCVQVALEKFARYFDVENRIIDINEKSNHLMDISKIKEKIDENTIGIFVIMGSTFTGAFEPVQKISEILDEVEKEKGYDVKIHVDGASGGFVAPFVFPHLKWDFSVKRVVSINTSGHKYGMTSAGLGWVIWKDADLLPRDVRFKLDYLGGVEETFNLNFSRPGFPVIHQYYNFLTLGREGYTTIFNSCIQNARLLSEFLEKSGYFECLSVIHKKLDPETKALIYTKEDKASHSQQAIVNEDYMPGLPVVSFRFSKSIRQKYPDIPQSIFSLLLRNKGFIVPNYRLPPQELEKEILRVVVRDSLSLNLLDKLMNDIVESIELLVKTLDTIHNVLTNKDISREQSKALIYEMLLSLASNGEEELKQLKSKKIDAAHSTHHSKRSYRGTC